jgi:hypothetical protein
MVFINRASATETNIVVHVLDFLCRHQRLMKASSDRKDSNSIFSGLSSGAVRGCVDHTSRSPDNSTLSNKDYFTWRKQQETEKWGPVPCKEENVPKLERDLTLCWYFIIR